MKGARNMNKLIIFLILAFVTVGCTTTQKGAGIGTVAGAGIGGIIGHQSGKGGQGAAIGGAAGALGGALIGNTMKKKFCPTGGESYDESVNYCPKHGVELQYKQK